MLDDDVIELPCVISPIYIDGVVLFLILLHVWYGGYGTINHDLRILLIFEKVPHVVLEETSLVHLEYFLLWDMNDKLVLILDVVSHYIVFMRQFK